MRGASGSTDSSEGAGVFGSIFGRSSKNKAEEEHAELVKQMDIANLVEEGMPNLSTTSVLRRRAITGAGGGGDDGSEEAEALGLRIDDTGEVRNRNESRGDDEDGTGDWDLENGKAKSGNQIQLIKVMMKAKKSFARGIRHVASDVLQDKGDEEALADAGSSNVENIGEDTFHDVRRLSFVTGAGSTTVEGTNLSKKRRKTLALEYKQTKDNESNVFVKALKYCHNAFVFVATALAWIWKFVRSNTITAVYLTMILNHLCHPTLLNIFYPVAVFGYGMCFNPRSSPPLSDLFSLYLHPLIQNPHPTFWLVVIGESDFYLCNH